MPAAIAAVLAIPPPNAGAGTRARQSRPFDIPSCLTWSLLGIIDLLGAPPAASGKTAHRLFR
jgi:hypothetical protein